MVNDPPSDQEKKKKALMCSICQFLWCKYSHHDSFLMSLRVELRRNAQIWLGTSLGWVLKHVGSCTRDPSTQCGGAQTEQSTCRDSGVHARHTQGSFILGDGQVRWHTRHRAWRHVEPHTGSREHTPGFRGPREPVRRHRDRHGYLVPPHRACCSVFRDFASRLLNAAIIKHLIM